MHRLQNPAVTRPVDRYSVTPWDVKCIDLPQMTLVLPPEVRLIDKLADRAVHD